jgi:transposase
LIVPSRIERKLLKLLDELAALDQQRLLVEAELEAHRHIDFDAQRDAVLGIEPLEATATRDDVARFHRLLTDIDRRRAHLEAERTRLGDRLGT